jgi:glutamine amidotransferase
MITIVNYGMGNLSSIANMLRRVGVEAVSTADPKFVRTADKLILPGVGAFDNGMRQIADLGLRPALDEAVRERGTPVLGICLGMQLLTSGSEEGELSGLGWISGRTVRFRVNGLKVPHMGWNTVRPEPGAVLFEGLEEGARFYFVHSYHVECPEDEALAHTGYGGEFVSAVGRGRIFGVQFHPEKSHRFGMQLLRNFAEKV